MAEIEQLVPRIVRVLDDVGIPFMLAGSFAGNAHGAPPMSHDLDIVVDLDEPKLEALLAALPAGEYHVDAPAAREALRTRSIFNIVDLATAWRVDFIVRKNRAFSRSEFARRVATEMFGVPVFLVSAEDTIVAELEWSKASGGAETQLRNAAAILAGRKASLDLDYVRHWVGELGLTKEWGQISGEG
jgi:hypothetical protein